MITLKKSAMKYRDSDGQMKDVGAVVGKQKDIPDYIIAEAERVVDNVQATRTAKSLVFPVMSDFHIYYGNELETHIKSMTSLRYAGMGIKELKKRMHLDLLGYLGDYTWGASEYTVKQVMKDITTVKESIDTEIIEIWCFGNHDLNYGEKRDRLMTFDEMYSYIGSNSDGVKPYENIEHGYGYLDFNNQKIRIIYLNTCDVSELIVTDGVSAPSSWISPTQIQWLADTALNFSDKTSPSDWGIALMSHHPLHDGGSYADNTMKILEAYRDGLSGTLSCTVRTEIAEDGTKIYPQQIVTYDFSNTERAEIICNIHGHNHNCGYSKISSSTRTGASDVTPWLWRFCVPQICASRYNTGLENAGEDELKQKNYGEFDEWGNPVYWYKETGTAKATSFCVINIDRKNKKIYAHIFGAGKDRVLYYGEEKSDTTINQIPISTDADGNIYNGVGYKADTKISSTGGVDATATGYGTTGFIPITYGTSSKARGEQVIYLDEIEALATDSNVRLAFYMADKSYIALQTGTALKSVENDDGTAVNVYTLNDNGYIASIDVTGYTSFLYTNQGKAPAFFRFCSPGLDGESVITVNEQIE